MARRKVPHAKYVNFRNDRLVIVFAHLLPHFKALQDVDSVLLSLCYLPFCNCPCWKMMKYSTVNNVAFVEAPETLGKKRRKLLKEAATRWFSYGEAFKRLIARFSCLIDALDVILEKGADQVFSMSCYNQIQSYYCCCSQMFWHISTGFYYFIKDKNLIWGEIAKMVNYFVSIPNHFYRYLRKEWN